MASALAARGAYAGLRRWPPAGEKTWARSNHRGEPVTLLEGPAVAVGAVTVQVMGQAIGAAVAARRISRPFAAPDQPRRWRASASPFAMAGLGALAFGVLDDLRGSAARRGLRGHLGALAHGEVTTGTVKLAGLAASGLGAALLEGGGPADVAINAGLIAGGANLLNLFDLRPGRAIKVAALSACLIAAGASGGSERGGSGGATDRSTGRTTGLSAVAAPAGAALALLPADLAEQAMLGDAGANALGALLGAAAARSLPRRARLCLLAGIAALTVASEKVSFTKVIAASPPLNWLDMLGRRPAAQDPAGHGSTGAAPVTQPGPQPVPAPRRRPPGRHRRSGDGEGRSRSGAWVSALVKTVARQEP
jgi:UDP-N-acetylmuramyl pentapeptide phosphotransferase/UDP-N-acetylglucosamine-1-phosphate transferase